jgi:hypothetical protein
MLTMVITAHFFHIAYPGTSNLPKSHNTCERAILQCIEELRDSHRQGHIAIWQTGVGCAVFGFTHDTDALAFKLGIDHTKFTVHDTGRKAIADKYLNTIRYRDSKLPIAIS